jgi:hypothetical protein
MPNRPSNPKPDPEKSVLNSRRPAFAEPSTESTNGWLPDATPGLNVDEQPLDPEDLALPDVEPCPPDAPPEDGAANVAAAAAAIAKWAFDTYCILVKHRLRVYNKYRRLVNEPDPSPITLGRYRHACRLACEQIVRRDFPVSGFDRGFYERVLPVFEIQFRCQFETPGSEVVNHATITGVVEVRQRRHPDDLPLPATGSADSEWSSSSSSSSSSEFDPG